ncbi:uncharacterized protein LOC115990341 [Quercus lobata]|uniref:uncharacterized protein LOC115990341 n=1 Tax=Quercus lobata TaxID=97700 RepID=UPI0012479B95|nr:uncharacterized protein LOC115990341 [Quercus lobata]
MARGRKKKEYRNWLGLPNDLTVSILQRLGAIYLLDINIEIMWKHAIDRSCEISTSTTLPPTNPSSTSPKAKLPLLEELDMMISSTSEELLKALKAFGRYCPLLKSLKWNQLWDGNLAFA